MTLSAYRYELTRWWGPGEDDSRKRVLWIMLNPSTADESNDDPTIRRCMGFSRDWDFPGLTVVNLFAYRATKPADLIAADFPVGVRNDYYIHLRAAAAPMIVCAWGTEARRHPDRADVVEWYLRNYYSDRLWALGLTRDGYPKHPLYVPSSVKPVVWEGK